MADLFSHQVSDIVAELLKDLSVGVIRGTAGDWPISVGKEQSSPDNVITVSDTEAKPMGRLQTNGEQLSYPGIQIRVRGNTERVAFIKALQIATKLDRNVRHNTVTIDSSVYCVASISRIPGIIYLGTQSNISQRGLFTLNAYTVISQIS